MLMDDNPHLVEMRIVMHSHNVKISTNQENRQFLRTTTNNHAYLHTKKK